MGDKAEQRDRLSLNAVLAPRGSSPEFKAGFRAGALAIMRNLQMPLMEAVIRRHDTEHARHYSAKRKSAKETT